MKVQLKLFATFRSYLPPGTQGSTVDVEIPAGTQVGELLARCGVPEKEAMMILVNGRGADLDRVVEDRDVVAVFPPMAGG